MQKKFIALAIAGLASGAAFAQSNVTIYGVADASAEIVNVTGGTNSAVNTPAVGLASRSRIQSNSSLIGFKGTEALGNGLNAYFQIESQVALDNATNGSSAAAATVGSTLATRDTFVGLKGAWGAVQLGFQSTPYRLQMAGFDLAPGATGVAGANGMIGRVNIGPSINTNTSFTNNTLNTTALTANNLNTIGRSQGIAYISPVFAGFQGSLFYSSNEGKATDATSGTAGVAQVDPHTTSGMLQYANGPFKTAYSYTVTSDGVLATTAQNINGNGLAVNGSRAASHLLSAMYTFGGTTTFSVMYNQNTVDFDDGITGAAAFTNKVKNNVWYFGGKHVMGAHEFMGNYIQAADGSLTVNGTGTLPTTVGIGGSAQDRGATQWSLRYAYNFSKRTQAYAMYSRINNKANGNYDFGAGTGAAQSNAAAVTVGAGADPQAMGVGIRHSF
jgi:predicted porin